jgi:hypothetical protein
MSVILATQELRKQRSGESQFEASLGKQFVRSYFEKKKIMKKKIKG